MLNLYFFRGSPDISIASDRFLVPPLDSGGVQPVDHASLSQHPLAHITSLSEEGASNCCSLSQHSLSPADDTRKPEDDSYRAIIRVDEGRETSLSGVRTEGRDDRPPTRPYDPLGGSPDDDASFLSGDVPARTLLGLLQKEVGMPSGSSSSAVSSASETSLNRTTSFGEGKSSGVTKPEAGQGAGSRQPSPGGPQTETGQHSSRMSQISNITVRSSNAQPDDGADALHRELRSEAERIRGFEPESLTPDQENATADTPLTGRVGATRGLLVGEIGRASCRERV